MNKKVRELDLGYLFVIGGPGGSGSSTISKLLEEHFSLERIYGGKMMREGIAKLGFPSLVEGFKEENMEAILEIDRKIDEYFRQVAMKKNILIESKVFADIAKKEDIPITVSIWLDSPVHTRVKRTLSKEGITNTLDVVARYLRVRKDLIAREKFDNKRYTLLYGTDYSNPEKWNDIVLDTSTLNEMETFNLILKLLKDGGYIK